MDETVSRRGLLGALGAATAGLAGCNRRLRPVGVEDGTPTGDATPTDRATPGGLPDEVALETVATGLRAPLSVAFPPEADHRYVLDRPGRIVVHGPDGLADEPLLDLRDAVETGGEKGLLGMALHPEFARNRRFYVRYSAPPRAGTPDGYSHTFVLAEFEATADGRRARRDSERTLLEIPEPQANHNAGDVAFGPDGNLYVPVGDGGAAADQGRGHVEDWYDGVSGGNGQDVTENLLGGLLRIDPDGRDGDAGYAVPSDNPLVGRDGLDEYYAWGLRNPWRLSFDGEDLFVGDVGQNRYEEVDLVEKGGNYGWNVREGAHCFRASDCPDRTPDDVRGGEPLLDPILEYEHAGTGLSGISVIGGYVYRGSALPSMEGAYLFGDLRPNGRLFAGTRRGDRWFGEVVPVADELPSQLLSFGRDPDGEVYVLGAGADGGAVYRVVPAG